MELRSEELLRRFVSCREKRDDDGARHWWDRLVEAEYDRVGGWVAVRAQRYGLSKVERDDAVSLALDKLWRNMRHSFRGTEMGQWVNSAKQLVEYSCQEVQRQAAKRSERETSVERIVDQPDWKGDELAQQEYGRDEERTDAADFVGWALPQLTNERRRKAIEDMLDGVPAEETAAELDVEVGNLYQLRTRGLKDMRQLRDRWYGA